MSSIIRSVSHGAGRSADGKHAVFHAFARKLPDRRWTSSIWLAPARGWIIAAQSRSLDVDQILEQLTDVPLQDLRKDRVMQRLRRELIGQEEILTQIDQQLQWMELGGCAGPAFGGCGCFAANRFL